MPGPVLATDYPKLIYFAERRAQVDASAFKARWREHARLGMSMPRWTNIRRYAHCDTIAVADSRLAIARCDGVGIIWYRDESRRQRHVTDTSAAPLMKQDEREAFARPVRESALLANEFVLQASVDAPYKLFLRFWRAARNTRADFRAWWLSAAGPDIWQRVSRVEAFRGYIQNHARLDAAEHAPPAVCDCVVEIACDEISACEVALLGIFDEMDGFDDYIGNSDAIWTSETILHDAP